MKTFPYTMTYSLQKTGTTTLLKAVGSAGIPCHRCYDGNIDQYHIRDMPTITMVREPVGRVVSELFEQGFSRDVAMSHIQGLIAKDLEWFDNHYRPITGINVYGHPFTKSKGWNIYSIRGLVVMTHMMNKVLEPALKEFLPPYFPDADYNSLTVEHRAKGDDRFGDAYKKFISKVKLPKKFLEAVYSSQFCSTFFLKKDLLAYIKKWAE